MPNAKAKGNRFEREICTKLSLWWTNGKDDNVFWRSTNSGGRATVRSKRNANKLREKHGGDICAIDPCGEPLLREFAIELKSGYSRDTLFDCLDALPGRKPQTYEMFIKQAQEATRQIHAKSWWLVTKRNRRRTMIFFPLDAHVNYPPNRSIEIYLPRMKVVGTDFDLFLSINDPEAICSKNS